MLTAIEALEFVKAHWSKLAVALCALLAVTTWQGCTRNLELNAKLAACEAKPPVIQYQTVTVTAKCHGTVIVDPAPETPCPKVSVNFGGESGGTATQTQEPGKGNAGVTRGPWGYMAGVGVYQGGIYPYLGGSVWTETGLGSLGLEAALLFPPAWEESQATRRPVGIVGLHIRP